MRLTTRVQCIAAIACGAVVGYIASSADLFSTKSAKAAPESKSVAKSLQELASSDLCADHADCCSDNSRNELLLAQAEVGAI